MSAKKTSGRNGSIRIRMYNVGFGDCFLLRIPTSEGERRVLVDCGYHTSGPGAFTDKQIVEQIQQDLDGKGLDVVIATHRHQDHISGFGETKLWEDIPVQEVWLPFTANPDAAKDDPRLKAWNGLMETARGLWDADGKLIPAATNALAARNDDERAVAEFMLWNARANAPGIANLLTGMRRADGRLAKRRFLPEARRKYPSKFTTPVLPGVTVHVLGPPADPAARGKRKVPATWGFDDGSFAGAGGAAEPLFSDEWRIPVDKLPKRRPFINKSLQQIRQFNDDLFYAAKAVDGFLNGESLVLVLEIGKARLLLTGDAEVGAWTTILENADALALASGATLVKIGHHGSHNATPLVFIREHLAKAVPAVISTQQGPQPFRNGIPLQALLDELDARGMPYVRSDDPPGRKKGIFEPEPKKKWVDCSVPC